MELRKLRASLDLNYGRVLRVIGMEMWGEMRSLDELMGC